MFRKDRKTGTGGGVFILISNDYIPSDPGLSYPYDIEMVWAQLQVAGSKVINICSFYQPPNITDPMYLQALSDTIAQTDTTKHHVWVADDFNLGDIDWRTASPTPNSQYTTLRNQLIDMANDNGLSQMVDKPTRTTSTTSSVLDLFLTNLPDMVN